MQSGITDRTLDAERGALVATTLCEAAGVDDVEGLRALGRRARSAAQAQALGPLLKPVGMMPFHPCIDGEIVRAAPAAALAGGAAEDVRLLAGTTSEEMNLFMDPTVPPPEHDRLVTRVAKYVGVEPHVAEAVVARYAAELGTKTASGPRCSAMSRCRCRCGGCSKPRAARTDLRVSLHVAGTRTRCVPRDRHPVHVRHLRPGRLGRLRRV